MAKYEDLRGDENSLLATTGRAWVFGDHVSRQQVLADAYLEHPPVAADATQRAVPAALKSLGLAAVIARSFGHFFARNAIHVGLPVLVVEETAAIKTGDCLRVDVEAHIVANLSSGDRYVVRNLDDQTLAILRAGGLVAHTRRQNT